MGLVWNPDGREITAAEQSGELQCITPIRLDLVACSFGDQRGRHDDAVDAHRRQLAVQRVAGWAGLIGHVQLDVRAAEPRHQCANRRRLIGDAAVTGWRTALVGDRHGNRGLMDIQTEVPNLAMVHHVHGPTSTYVALHRTSFVRLRNLRYCVRRPFHNDFPRRPPAYELTALEASR